MDTIPAAVLIIENHPMLRAALCAAIADELDLTIAAVAAHGVDILQMAPALHPEIILFAIGNPAGNDLEVLAALHESLPGTPILALTSNEVSGQEQAALEHGAQAVLTKAAPRAELLRSLRELHTKTIINRSENKLAQEAGGKILQ
jgi:DNA-binding NarL/FixJ family response regulator